MKIWELEILCGAMQYIAIGVPPLLLIRGFYKRPEYFWIKYFVSAILIFWFASGARPYLHIAHLELEMETFRFLGELTQEEIDKYVELGNDKASDAGRLMVFIGWFFGIFYSLLLALLYFILWVFAANIYRTKWWQELISKRA